MSVEMVFNELSLAPPAPDVSAARERMSLLVSTISVAISKHRVASVLRTQQIVKSLSLCGPSYSMGTWLADQAVRKDEKWLLQKLATKSPLLLPDEHQEIQESAWRYDIRYEQQEANGLSLAYRKDWLAISLLSGSCWDRSKVSLSVRYIAEQYVEENDQVNHASRPEHLNTHERWLKETLEFYSQAERKGIGTRNELWEKKAQLFPHLEFCDSVERDFDRYRLEQPMLGFVVRRLLDMEQYFSSWKEGGFNKEGFRGKTKPESEATLNKYGEERTFACPDGRRRIFSWHVWLDRYWRIHFIPDEERRIAIIGYIGHHLSIATG